MRGPLLVGSGKSGTPLARMHWANLRRAAVCWVVKCVGIKPAGSRLWHALMACFHAALLGSSSEPALIPYAKSPEASGSGNSLTPLPRMHSANFTAVSTLAAELLLSLLVFEPHALSRATIVTRARAASGRGLLVTASPRSPKILTIVAMTAAMAMGIVDCAGLLSLLVRCGPCLQSTQRRVASTYLVFDMPPIRQGS